MPCAVCCEGLERFNADSACSPAPPSLFYCGKCGDGVCTEGENECTCPKDCALDAGEPRPADSPDEAVERHCHPPRFVQGYAP
jgi:hypothetical protein